LQRTLLIQSDEFSRRRVSKDFFSEEKKQKTFIFGADALAKAALLGTGEDLGPFIRYGRPG
jgi:hypothetical protein